MEETAYHEAGHALMAEVVGARVRLVTIEPEADDEQPRHGETEVAWKRSRRTEREYHERAIQVALGGPIAEMLYSGDPYHPGFVTAWALDWQTALELATPLLIGVREAGKERTTDRGPIRRRSSPSGGRGWSPCR